MTREELVKKFPEKEFGRVRVYREFFILTKDFDWREWDKQPVKDGGWCIFMEHQCDEWEIGDVVQAKAFLKDLEEAITYCESFKE